MCYKPINLSRTDKPNLVPCGKCPKCKSRLVSNWAFRLMQEEKHCLQAFWCTLTYGPDQLDRSPNGYLTFARSRKDKARHVQLFFKRLRQNQNRWYKKQKTPKQLRKKIKYFLVAEYGSEGERPHFHAHIFNAAPDCIRAAWTHGYVYFGTVTYASCIYTMKYVMKPGKVPYHKRDDRVPEFRLMSKGLGANYLTPAMVKFHRDDIEDRAYITLDGGQRVGMPRYYLNKIYSSLERERIREHQESRRDSKWRTAVLKDGDAFIRSYLQGVIRAYSKMYSDIRSRDKKVDLWVNSLSEDLKLLLMPHLQKENTTVVKA